MSDFHRSTNFWVGLDVHKDSVTAAVFRNRDRDPMCVDRMPYDLKKIRRYFKRLEAVDRPPLQLDPLCLAAETRELRASTRPLEPLCA